MGYTYILAPVFFPHFFLFFLTAASVTHTHTHTRARARARTDAQQVRTGFLVRFSCCKLTFDCRGNTTVSAAISNPPACISDVINTASMCGKSIKYVTDEPAFFCSSFVKSEPAGCALNCSDSKHFYILYIKDFLCINTDRKTQTKRADEKNYTFSTFSSLLMSLVIGSPLTSPSNLLVSLVIGSPLTFPLNQLFGYGSPLTSPSNLLVSLVKFPFNVPFKPTCVFGYRFTFNVLFKPPCVFG